MLEFEYKADDEQTVQPEELLKEIKQEEPQDVPMLDPNESKDTKYDSWLDFFAKDTTEVNVDEMFVKNIKKEVQDNYNETENTQTNEQIISNGVEPDIETKVKEIKIEAPPIDDSNRHKKRIMKYMDPTTRKIYYLEVDRDLDLSKVQEIVINSQGEMQTAKISPIKSNGLKHVRKKPVSLLKPEIKNQLKKNVESDKIRKNIIHHIENDHCYLATSWSIQERKVCEVKSESICDTLKKVLTRFSCTRVIVSYLLKKIPLINTEARNPNFVQCLPFVVDSDEKYWKLDFAKRRNMEVY